MTTVGNTGAQANTSFTELVVYQDFAIGRIYLPKEDYLRFGYDRRDFDVRRINPGLRRRRRRRPGEPARPWPGRLRHR